MKLTVKDIEELMDHFASGKLTRMKYTGEGESLELRCENARPAAPEVSNAEPADISVPAEPADDVKDEDPGVDGTPVRAALAGVFYRAPKPGEKPYVEVGSKVEKGQTVGLLEAMKMMSEIPAPVKGTVRKILLKDSEFAEYDTVIMIIDPE